jgi:uncharacterized membrane protein (DUF2068 family)
MNRRGSRIAILAAMLALRGCVNAALGVWMLTRRPGWTDVFDAGSIALPLELHCERFRESPTFQ